MKQKKASHTNVRFPVDRDIYPRIQVAVQRLNDRRKPGAPKLSINAWILKILGAGLLSTERRLDKKGR